MPAPGDLVIAFYGYRAQGDPLALARVILTCAVASTTGTLVPYFIARRWGLPVAVLAMEQGCLAAHPVFRPAWR